MLWTIIGATALIGVGGFVFMRAMVPRWSPMPDNLGVTNGSLAPCPNKPNCVSTQAGDAEHRMEPVSYTSSTSEARDRVLEILRSMDRSTVVTVENDYIHAEFRSPTMGFIDDVEVYFDEMTNTMHFRSAARLGRSDLGANRQRMEEMVAQFNEVQAANPAFAAS